MNISDMMTGAGGAQTQQLASQFGLTPEQANSAMKALVPLMTAGLQREVSTRGDTGLATALQTGNHERYITQPELLAAPATTTEGNAILGHIFGSKDVSRKVATQASQKTGISSDILKKMLPIIAPMVMGALAKQMGGGGADRKPAPRGGAMGGAAGGGLGGILGGLLDRDGDGSPMDDLAGMIGGAIGGRR